MKRITSKDFVWLGSETHTEPLLFRMRQKKRLDAAKAERAKAAQELAEHRQRVHDIFERRRRGEKV